MHTISPAATHPTTVDDDASSVATACRSVVEQLSLHNFGAARADTPCSDPPLTELMSEDKQSIASSFTEKHPAYHGTGPTRCASIRTQRTTSTRVTNSSVLTGQATLVDDADNNTAVSMYVASVSLPPRRHKHKVPGADDIEVDLLPVFDAYERLHAAVCRRETARLPDAAETFTQQLSLTVQGVDRTAGSVRYASAYESAKKNLKFSQELLELHYSKVHWDDTNDTVAALATGYQLMEMTMASFRSLLQAVETECEALETPIETDMSSNTRSTAGKLRIMTENLKPKKALFQRLRRLSRGCMAAFDISLPPTPIVTGPGEHGAPGSVVRPARFSDDSGSTSETEPEPLRESYLEVRPPDESSHVPYTIKASLDVFPEPSPKLTQLSLPSGVSYTTELKRAPDGTIIAATLPELIRILTDQHEILSTDRPDLLDAFFLFFRSFAPPAIFMDMLVERYNQSAPAGLDEVQLHAWRLYQRFAKINIAKLLCLWLENYWKESADSGMLNRIIQFTFGTLTKDTDLPEDTAKLVASSLCECASGRRSSEYGLWLAKEIKQTEAAAIIYKPTEFQPRLEQLKMLRPDQLSMVDIGFFRKPGGAEELARQLTVIESELFHSFLPEDLIHFGDPKFRRNLDRWKAFSNALSLWVTSCILDHREAVVRAQLIELFTSVASTCKRMRNYNSALAILLGLQSNSITRLEKTEQAMLPYRESRIDLENFFDPRSNWSMYRAEVTQNIPAIPLTVAMIKDTKLNRELLPRIQSTVVPLSAPIQDMIPLQYYRNMRKTVRDLEKCYGSYNLERVDLLYDWLKNNISPFEKEEYDRYSQVLYKKSLLLEPKQPDNLP
ncbi:ras GEF [Laetiporus sulphureus 93-53]|uniref:Ras GEF n=1 Tax=Laetiporus sulphureus 93-53 TaxID=1314785 RepID=A0A165FL80_9APHY|nr:ras GEF [Laetiporus sulphureus 93-53]KZT09138.1 ras GEF [Laetiporus sulphureus 93-53]